MAAKLALILRWIADYLSPAPSGLGAQVEALLRDPAYQPVLRAIRKTNTDRVLASADADVKRAETLQWAEYYSNKKIARQDAWKTRFLLELLVGLEKGLLKR